MTITIYFDVLSTFLLGFTSIASVLEKMEEEKNKIVLNSVD